MMFINSVADLRLYVSSIQDGTSFTAYAPTVRKVTRFYIEPHFPKALRLRLTESLSTGDELTTEETVLRDLIRESIACFTAFKYSFTGAVVQTGSGLQHFESENFKSAYKYEKDDYRNELEESGFAALEAALIFACENKVDIGGDYATSNEYAKTVSRLVNFTADFEGSGYNMGRKTVALLLPHIALIERETVEPVLTTTIYKDLVARQYFVNSEKLSDLQRKLLQLYREGLAQFAIQIAMDLNLVTFSGNRVYVREQTRDDAHENRLMPKMDMYTRMQEARNEYAARYFAQAKKFLVANAMALEWTDPSLSSVVKENPVGFMGFLKRENEDCTLGKL